MCGIQPPNNSFLPILFINNHSPIKKRVVQDACYFILSLDEDGTNTIFRYNNNTGNVSIFSFCPRFISF